MKALLVLYSHVEGYPPSLNAIQLLSAKFESISIVHRNTLPNTWVFPGNVKIVSSRKLTPYTTIKTKSPVWKAVSFLKFTRLFYAQIKKNKPDWLIIHDPLALMSWYLITKIYRSRPKVWYHNHDVILGNESFLAKYAYKAQNAIFKDLDVFSLPANERKINFPMESFKGNYFYLPNYPGRYLYDRYFQPRKKENSIKLVFQGHIGAGHCLEEILQILRDPNIPYDLHLVLKGFKDEAFLAGLMKLAAALDVSDRVHYHPVSSYTSVPEVASQSHIGIGIHTGQDVMNRTLGTASNKIYEYAALGLPVLLFDSPHFKSHLQEYSWAFFTDGSVKNLKQVILEILNNYEQFSTAARNDFNRKLNFEFAFKDVLQQL
jgi:hypothetical protein